METFSKNTFTPPFSFLFAQKVLPIRDADQTGGAETEVESGRDGVVKKDSEEDEDTDK